MLIDSHVHLTDPKFAPDLDRVIARARDAGVERFVSIADDLASARRAIALAARRDDVYATVGVHPQNERRWRPECEAEIRALAREPKVVAIGEIGLDFHWPDFRRERQIEVFTAQVRLATELGLPTVIHCRDAYDALAAVFRGEPGLSRRGVVHCFSGTVDDARTFLDMGFHLGIGGAVTYPGPNDMREAVKFAGLDRVVCETDAPYLPPQKKRGRRNEPSYMKFAVAALAEIAGMSYADAARITTANSRRLYGLPEKSPAEIAYAIRRRLYLNLTNRCTNDCGFCERNADYMLHGHYLKLPGEPTAAEILAAIREPERYEEFVVCGLGEPTLRLDVALEVARTLKKRGARVRLNTNGHADLIHGRRVSPDFAGLFDAVTITMNAHDRETYNRVSCPAEPERSWDAMLAFARDVRNFVPDVRMKAIALPGVDIEACRKIAEDDLKVKFQVRAARPGP